LLLNFNPVSVGVAVPDAYSRSSVANGAAVLLPAGDACSWNVWGTAIAEVLLKDEATKSSGREYFPPVAVAVPCAGRFSLPPTLIAVAPVCERIDFWMLVAVVNRGTAFTVPPVVVTFDDAGGSAAAAAGLPEVAADELPFTVGAASMKAEGGSPPTVCASPAFRA